jgi:hypothetical protein
MTPRPPALLTALANLAFETTAIPARRMGCRMFNVSAKVEWMRVDLVDILASFWFEVDSMHDEEEAKDEREHQAQ